MTMYFLCKVISNTGTLIASLYICSRAMNQKVATVQKVLFLTWCILWAVFFAIEPAWMPLQIIRMLSCVSSIILIWITLKIKIDAATSSYLLSFGASYVLYAMSFFIIGFPFAPFLSTAEHYDSLIDFSQPIYLLFYTLIATLQFTFAIGVFKIRRFKLGFPFLFGRYMVAIALVITGVFLSLSSLIVSVRGQYDTYHVMSILAASSIIIGIGIFIWIRRMMKVYQKKRAWEINQELILKENEKLRDELEHYKEMHESVRAANHRTMHRLSAAEQSIASMMKQARTLGFSSAFSDELSMSLEDVLSLSREYEDMIGTEPIRRLPPTNVPSMDALFKHFAGRFAESKIDFNLKVKGSVAHMIETVVGKDKLETLIGDHLQDALIAVNAGDSAVRSVLAMIGEVDGYYEFSAQDSGIPFEVDTLVRLGTERVTTHEKDGGSGEGFMTTFETMRKYGASLIIRENPPGSSFSKVVTVRFDGQSRYIIETHRPGVFPSNDRYTVAGYK